MFRPFVAIHGPADHADIVARLGRSPVAWRLPDLRSTALEHFTLVHSGPFRRPYFEGYGFTSLGDYTETGEDAIDGNYTRINDGHVETDPLGMALLLIGKHGGADFVTNSIHIARALPEEGSGLRSVDSAQLFRAIAFTNCLPPATPLAGMTALRPFERARLGADGIAIETQREWTKHLFSRTGDDPVAAITDFARQLARRVSTIPRARAITLTGGYDSRVVLAAAIRAGVHQKSWFTTTGAPDNPDVKIARTLRLSLNLAEVTFGPGKALSPEELLVEAAESTLGFVMPECRGRRAVDDNWRILGGGSGELYRGFYLAKAGPEPAALSRVFATIDFRGVANPAAHQQAIRDALASIDETDALDLYYILSRNRFHFGLNERLLGNGVSILPSAYFFAATRNIPATSLTRDIVPAALIKSLCPALLDFPGTFRPPDLTDPLLSAIAPGPAPRRARKIDDVSLAQAVQQPKIAPIAAIANAANAFDIAGPAVDDVALKRKLRWAAAAAEKPENARHALRFACLAYLGRSETGPAAVAADELPMNLSNTSTEAASSPVPSKIVQYQGRDAAVVDYELFELPELEYTLRGPRPASLEPRQYAAVLGAGQSFGVLVQDPYVHKLQQAIGFPFLNLSVGGSAPGLYLRNPAYLDYVNNARFCIVQVQSARGSENSYFEARHGKNMLRPRGSKLPFVPGDTAFEKMIEHEPPALVRAVIGEVRANWIRETIQLLARIKVPKILLWFSKRTPEYGEGRDSYKAMAGMFPQFVNRAMMDEVVGFADQYVEVVSSRGMPHVLLDKSTDQPIEVFLGDAKVRQTVNTYYPSPEMHEDAFASLLPALGAAVTGTATRRKRPAARALSGADA